MIANNSKQLLKGSKNNGILHMVIKKVEKKHKPKLEQS